MTGTGRPRRLAILIAAVGLLVAVGVGVGRTPDAEHLPGRSSPAVRADGILGAGTPGALGTRLSRDIEARPGQWTSRVDGLAGAASLPGNPQAWVRALAGLLERAGHPERSGQILLRGPPGLSA